MAWRSSCRLTLSTLAVCLVLGPSLAGCGGGGGHARPRARGLLVILERLPVASPADQLERVVVVRGALRVEVSPRTDKPQWRVVRRLTLTKVQQHRLTRYARAVHGWKNTPASTCPGLPRGANVGELLIRVGRHQTLCPTSTAGPLIAFLRAYLPISSSA